MLAHCSRVLPVEKQEIAVIPIIQIHVEGFHHDKEMNTSIFESSPGFQIVQKIHPAG